MIDPHRTTRLAALTLKLALLLPAAMLAGCDTIAQDLGSLGDNLLPPTPTEAAVMMTDQYDADARREGTILISNAPFGGVESYVDLYRLMVETETDPTVLTAAIQALARHGQPPDAILIASHLANENFHVRWEAAKGLQRIHNPQVVGAMLEVIRDEGERDDVRQAIAYGLGQYREDRVFQTLVSALDARSLSINKTAQNSLVGLTGQDFGDRPAPWLDWYEEIRESDGKLFTDELVYVYPTYQRDETTMEKIAFWSKKTYEQPAPPAGMRPDSVRSTYDDFDGAGEPEESGNPGEGPQQGG